MNEKNSKKFFTAKYDRVFKTIFCNEENKHLLEALLKECLNREVKIKRFINNELPVTNTKERTKRLDCVFEAEDGKYTIELNTNYDLVTRYRNYTFLSCFLAQDTRMGEVYDVNKKYYHIDLSYNMSNKMDDKEVYYVKNAKEELYINQVSIITINMDKIKRMWYDNDKEAQKYKYLLMLDLNKEELANFKGKDEIMMEFEDKINKLNTYSFWPYTEEEDFEMMTKSREKLAYDEGEERGETKACKSIAQRLLNMGLSIAEVATGCGLSEKEVVKLSKNIKQNMELIN